MMKDLAFLNSKILIVGGAGFVGSNLAHFLLSEYQIKELWIVDNLLSSDTTNIPVDNRLIFLLGSIAEDKILNKLPKDLDYVFHLACYHGNQSSIENPLKDHENNTFTSLKLFEHLKDYKGLKKVVYAAAGCAVAEKTYDDAQATLEDAPNSLNAEFIAESLCVCGRRFAEPTAASAAAAMFFPCATSLDVKPIPLKTPDHAKPPARAPAANPRFLIILSDKKFAVNKLLGSHQLPSLSL